MNISLSNQSLSSNEKNISNYIHVYIIERNDYIPDTFVTEITFPPDGTSSVILTSHGVTGSATCTVSTAYTSAL